MPDDTLMLLLYGVDCNKTRQVNIWLRELKRANVAEMTLIYLMMFWECFASAAQLWLMPE
jgi:hypothetical protein